MEWHNLAIKAMLPLAAILLTSSPTSTQNNGNKNTQSTLEQKIIHSHDFRILPSYEYKNIAHSDIIWEQVADGLDFSRTEIYQNNALVDVISSLKINPEKNKLKVFNGFNESVDFIPNVQENFLKLSAAGNYTSIVGTIEDWQKTTGALAMINSAQYMGGPQYYCPIMAVIMNGKLKGPKINQKVEGMLVSEPTQKNLPKIDLIDFKYDKYNKFNPLSIPYSEGVQHYMILLDRNNQIRVSQSSWQANRTVVAKTKDNNILLMTTEGGYFTLYNFGRFLRDSNSRADKGFNIHTAMNMDGGYEADMVVNTPKLSYVTYGEFETYGPNRDASVFDRQIEIPGVIGVFPRN